jgi:glucokinase
VVAAAVDFGGTGVKLALVTASGERLARAAFDTRAAANPAAWVEAVEGCLRRLAEEAHLPVSNWVGVGVGAPGFVDFAQGRILTLPNVPGWDEFPLAETLAGRLGRPVWVDNDVNAMALGECVAGAGRDLQQAVFLTLGTGVGGAIVLHGRVHRGAHGLAGEIGHLSIHLRGPRSPTGIGGLEQYIGNQAIVALARRRLLRPGAVSRLADAATLSVRDIAEAAAAGDALARGVFDRVGECLASALASVAYLIQPEAFIIGGGVAQAGEVLFAPLREHLARRLHPRFLRDLRLLPAALGADAGVVGCAALAFQGARA